MLLLECNLFFFSSRRRHTRSFGDWSSDVCSSDLPPRQSGCRVEGNGPLCASQGLCSSAHPRQNSSHAVPCRAALAIACQRSLKALEGFLEVPQISKADRLAPPLGRVQLG